MMKKLKFGMTLVLIASIATLMFGCGKNTASSNTTGQSTTDSSEILEINLEVANLNTKIEELSGLLQDKTLKIEQLNTEVANLKTKVEELNRALQNKTIAIDEFNLQVANLKTQIKEVKDELLKVLQTMPNEKRVVIQGKADKILFALKNKNFTELSEFVRPQKGLRFSPYTNINTTSDLVFSPVDISNLLNDSALHNWGVYDGSGAPINLTFTDYYAKFIYDKDFLAAPQIIFNQVVQRGNMVNNFNDVYPQCVSIEYYFQGFDAQYEGMDWESLKLVFEQVDANWYLVGIIHEQWTI